MKDIETIFNDTMGSKNYYFAYDYDCDDWVTENPIDLFENELLANGYTFEVIDENYFEINGKVYSCSSQVVAVHESDTAKAFAEFEDEDGNAPEWHGEWEYEYYNFEEDEYE